ncbi:hypothetical protein EJ08DRAFT_652638 [Tothia fuscella]|uniref:Phosphatidic acid phosphatase type 2/haloperoxidase domain-containing protein n=1 Tax=Tothia fuscella TaxID=1048955 RepID=A0A9P4TTZ7_9PEZI|nr:hypothetical protein EJ08DRAFT_652638 [Tothia fuscella]
MSAGRTDDNDHSHSHGLQSRSKKQTDAGMRHVDHYSARLPQWRYRFRQWLIPIVRAETPYLALIQDKIRTPALDQYFALTANLGTHTFFMIMLPILFWCGWATFARAMVHLLALGVILSGIVKDLLCLPRPLSPPLQRITMSGSAALEYGFPSTHSTNAISVVVYALYILNLSTDMDPTTNLALQILSYSYGISIVFGRLYCGMHGFFDVIIGSILGALIAYAQIIWGDTFDIWMHSGTYISPLIITLILLAIVRTHPEPADDCPCFDDSVAFAGVLIGVEFALWHYASTPFAWSDPVPGTTPYSLSTLGLPITILRTVLGVFIVFAWRGTMKPLLFAILPPIFRTAEQFGADLPRKFFLKASEYEEVPRLRRDDNVIPSASEIPNMVNSVRMRRGRAVSVGPQSAADAYETIAIRNEQRRRSISVERKPSVSGGAGAGGGGDTVAGAERNGNGKTSGRTTNGEEGYFSPIRRGHTRSHTAPGTPGTSFLPTPMEDSSAVVSSSPSPNETRPFPDYNEQEKERQEIFSSLERVRARYDVEVITKLIVYTGIAWLAVEGNPILFELVGLGMGKVDVRWV